MKRQRGRGRRPGGGGGGQHHQGGGHPNRTMESSGPEVKVRGPASHIYERYLQLSRDAASAGDRVLSENYAQHADHYFRLVRSMQPAMPPPQPQNFNEGAEFESEESAPETAELNGEAAAGGDEGGEQPDVDFPSGEQQQHFNRERGEGDFRGRRRGRRNRYRGDGDRGERGEGEVRSEGGESREDDGDRGEQRAERQDRGERQERRERQPRERDEQSGPEGFSNGPKPAFLRDN
ncbi:MAG: DUF4167 domain-containing protein [Proteobacteria bacterium]|nr:DUF4167 domain-containing protein [Pseudomonadota bacterium]